MEVTHELEVTANCPADNKPDVYLCKVRARRVIPVETILEAVGKVKEASMYQEDICQELHRVLACEVTLTGYHSGVRTTVTCGGLQ